MLFTTALPAIAALVSVASAAPLEARGYSHKPDHSYPRQCGWVSQNNGWITVTCDNKDWWAQRNCCKTERKCYRNYWKGDNQWECCNAEDWDWDHNCPKSYYTSGSWGWDNQKVIYYGGYTSDCVQKYKNDCDQGRSTYYQGHFGYKSFSDYCSTTGYQWSNGHGSYDKDNHNHDNNYRKSQHGNDYNNGGDKNHGGQGGQYNNGGDKNHGGQGGQYNNGGDKNHGGQGGQYNNGDKNHGSQSGQYNNGDKNHGTTYTPPQKQQGDDKKTYHN